MEPLGGGALGAAAFPGDGGTEGEILGRLEEGTEDLSRVGVSLGGEDDGAESELVEGRRGGLRLVGDGHRHSSPPCGGGRGGAYTEAKRRR